jgi:hypothetical protein
MKKLGELNIGDTFYIVNRDPQGVFVTSVEKHIISDILTIKIGKIFKWKADEYGSVLGVTIVTSNYENTTVHAHYNSSICADKKAVEKLLKRNKKIFIENHNRMLSAIYE